MTDDSLEIIMIGFATITLILNIFDLIKFNRKYPLRHKNPDETAIIEAFGELDYEEQDRCIDILNITVEYRKRFSTHEIAVDTDLEN